MSTILLRLQLLSSRAWLPIVKELTVEGERNGEECSSVRYISNGSFWVRETTICHFCIHWQWGKSWESNISLEVVHIIIYTPFYSVNWTGKHISRGCFCPEGGIAILKPVVHLESDGKLQFSGMYEAHDSLRGALNLKQHLRQQLLLLAQHNHWMARGYIPTPL